MAFKDMLKYFRMRNGLSQRELADRLGCSPSRIGMYESGAREPDFETEERIADYFNVSLDTLRGKDTECPIPSVLSQDEQELVEKYQCLDDKGKEKLMDRADELIALGHTVDAEAKKDKPISA